MNVSLIKSGQNYLSKFSSSNLNILKYISTSNSCLNEQKSSESSRPKSSQKSPPQLAFADDLKNNEKAENISRAMSYYIEKLTERESIIKFKTEEYEIGKRHLARMMGNDPNNFDQNDIDKAIKYLLPSSLFIKSARPFLKHPEDYYPKSRMAEFDKEGRPLHSLFYTGAAPFFQLIYDMTQKYLNLNKIEDALKEAKSKIKTTDKNELDNVSTKVDLTGSTWISHNDLSKKFNTKIDEFNYKKFLVLLQKLADHPLSKREEIFIKQYIVPFEPAIKLSEIPQLVKDENGISYQIASAKQRTAYATVKMYEGAGNIEIESPEGIFDISFFESLTHREQLLFPFKTVDRINKFDLYINVNHGGMSCLAKAIRYAISKCLCSFVSVDDIEKLRLAGLLTRDERVKERQKPGRQGARRRYTWKAR